MSHGIISSYVDLHRVFLIMSAEKSSSLCGTYNFFFGRRVGKCVILDVTFHWLPNPELRSVHADVSLSLIENAVV
jgi:hypothetical protein